jgi:xanthine/CO dehydrogenase XdhC/CoxF family maturation factor
MHHNLKLDGEALQMLQHSSALYVGLLGPYHRTERLLSDMNMNLAQLTLPLANPVGLNLGGDLPETIALSILSEAQARLAERDARSFSLLSNSAPAQSGAK